MIPLRLKSSSQDTVSDLGGRVATLWMALLCFWIYQYFATDLDEADVATRAFPSEIISGQAPSPYRYRIGAPLLARLIELVPGVGVGASHKWLILGSFLLLFYFVRRACLNIGLTRTESLAALGILAVHLILTFQVTYYSPWAILEITLLAASLCLVMTERYSLLLLGCLTLWSLTRETVAFFLAGLWLLAIHPTTRRQLSLSRVVLLSAPPLLLQVCLRLVWPGPAPFRTIEIDQIIAYNLDGLVGGAIAMGLLAPIFSLAAVAAYRALKNSEAKPVHVIWLGVFVTNLTGHLVYAIWWETRVLLPAVVISVPLATQLITRAWNTV